MMDISLSGEQATYKQPPHYMWSWKGPGNLGEDSGAGTPWAEHYSAGEQLQEQGREEDAMAKCK